MNIPWGPSHQGQWAYGTSLEDALRKYNEKYPKSYHKPNTYGYEQVDFRTLDHEKIKRELGEAFNIQDEQLTENYTLK